MLSFFHFSVPLFPFHSCFFSLSFSQVPNLFCSCLVPHLDIISLSLSLYSYSIFNIVNKFSLDKSRSKHYMSVILLGIYWCLSFLLEKKQGIISVMSSSSRVDSILMRCFFSPMENQGWVEVNRTASSRKRSESRRNDGNSLPLGASVWVAELAFLYVLARHTSVPVIPLV